MLQQRPTARRLLAPCLVLRLCSCRHVRCAHCAGCSPALPGIFGALYCLADVHTEFSEVAKQLKEVAELLGSGLNRALSSHLAQDYVVRGAGVAAAAVAGVVAVVAAVAGMPECHCAWC